MVLSLIKDGSGKMLAVVRFVIFCLLSTLFVQNLYAEAKFFNSDLSSGFSSDASGLYGDFLPPEQAFIYSASALDQQQMSLNWVVADGYYLYKDKFVFTTVSDVQVERIVYPEGVMVEDPKYGAVEVFKGEVVLQLILDQPLIDRDLTLKFSYQGCAEGGLCYPLMQGDYPLIFPADLKPFDSSSVPPEMLGNNTVENERAAVKSMAVESIAKTETDLEWFSQDWMIAVLTENGFFLNLILFFVAGIISAFLGCSYPLIPIVSSLIAGQGERITPLRGAVLSLVYVVAMATVFGIAGGITAAAGINVTVHLQNSYFLVGTSLVFVILALAMFGKLTVAVPAALTNYFNQLSNRQKGGSYAGVAIMGALSALIAGPCMTPILAGALVYIIQNNDVLLGSVALFALGLGTGAPLIVVGAGLGSFLPKAGDWMNLVKGFFGFVLLGLALWFIQQGGLPVRYVNGIWGCLFIGAGVFFSVKSTKALKRIVVIYVFSAILIVSGVVTLVGSGYGGKSLLHPFTRLAVSEFTYVRSIDELQQRITGDKSVVIYFSAEWCVVCRHLEANVLSEVEVVAALQTWNPTKVDLTDIEDFQQALMDKYQIVGPPTFIFLDGNGDVQRRIVGNVDKDGLLQALQQ